jgi:GntR family transcriptional regulator/MocR family aminotransferase
MTLPIPLDRDAPETLQEQIYGWIRDQILSGAFAPGLRLCATRELAESLRVSRNTAVLAYQWLVSEGYLETQTGAGTFVCDVLGRSLSPPRGEDPTDPAPEPRYPPLAAAVELPDMYGRIYGLRRTDLWYGRVDPRLFPAKVWRRLINEHLFAVPTRLAEYAPPTGAPELKQAIARHLASTKGIVARPEQVIVTAGAQEALNLVARLLVKPGTSVGLESPGYASAMALFSSYGAEVTPLQVDEEGLSAEALASAAPHLVYATPSHQFPSGVIMSPQRRRDLLGAAREAGAYVLEDDYDGEIIYDRPPVAALAALDQDGRVLYVGSFSKSLGAGLRLGFLVAPPHLVAPLGALKMLASYGTAWLEQAVLAAYLESGSFDAHLRRVRRAYRERRDTLVAELLDCFGPEATITGDEAGLHLVCTLPAGGPSADEVVALAATLDVGLYTPALAGSYEPEPPTPERRLLIGYAHLAPAEIQQAFRRLAAALGRSASAHRAAG